MTSRLLWGLVAVCVTACNLTLTPSTAPRADSGPLASRLVVAWVENGNLLAWQTGDESARRVASGGVISPFVSPDGAYIAFTRGVNGIPESLWAIETQGIGEVQLIGGNQERTFQSGKNLIGNVAWYDAETLYFNTLELALPSLVARDDLYRANVRTREIALIRTRGEGGRFTFSPDKQHIALVSAGTYGRQDARISVIDPLAQDEAVNLLFYVGVASGEHSGFYAPVYWSADSTSLLAIIPEKDLLYQDTTTPPPTTLWQLPIESPSDRKQIATVQASYFGLPVLNADLSAMAYLQRQTASNRFSLLWADGLGQNATLITEGNSGELGMGEWLPDGRLLWAQTDGLWVSDGDSSSRWPSTALQFKTLADGSTLELWQTDTDYTLVWVNAVGGQRISAVQGVIAFDASLSLSPIP